MKRSTIAKLASAIASATIIACLAGCAGQAEEVQEQAPEPEPQVGIKLDVTAEGWDAEASTPVVAVLTPAATEEASQGASEGQEAPADASQAPEPIYHELKANEEQVIELAAGTYDLGLISPINADGSIYTVPDDASIESKELTEDAEAMELVLIPADQVQASQLEGIVSALTVASQTNPDAIPVATLERAKVNALVCPNASAEQIEAAESAAADAVASGDKAAIDNAVASRPTASAPSGASSGSSESAGSGSLADTGAAQAPSAPSAPAHTHTFDIPVWGQERYLVSAGYDTILCSCGASFSSTSAWGAHDEAIMIETGSGHSYSVQSTPPQYGYRDVITGYKCSCGVSQ